MEFFYQPEMESFYTKVCPAPMTPKYLIKEVDKKGKRGQDAHFSKHATSFYSGWLFFASSGILVSVKIGHKYFQAFDQSGYSFVIPTHG